MSESQTKSESGIEQPLVLAGAGHAHLVLMRSWRDRGYQPPPGTVLVAPESHAWYSGMMPGLIAGRFQLTQCAIDLQPWCQALGITLRLASVVALNSQQRCLQLDDGTELAYQKLSINTGSMTAGPPHNDGSVPLIPAKPFSRFIDHWQHWQQQPPRRLLVAGGGAAAFELVVALRRAFPTVALRLVCASELLASHPKSMRLLARAILQQQHIHCDEHTRLTGIAQGELFAGTTGLGGADALILATGASALPWYRQSGLACDDNGFLRVNACLQSVTDPEVLVSGDAAAAPGSQHSGVFSVRHGPVLAHNLRALLEHTTLLAYQPQAHTLALLATGDGGALMSYGRYGAGNRLLRRVLGRWKDHLDLGFMRRHSL